MNSLNYKLCDKIIPASYVRQGQEARKVLENRVMQLLEQNKLPEEGWTEQAIEMLLSELALMDSNNFPGNCGVGEREARIMSALVARRHYHIGHGIGRSGNIADIQPKAAGSSIMMKLTNNMVCDAIRLAGVQAVTSAFVVPMATGMTLMLCMLAFKSTRREARYVLWPRIDQKSCFKSIVTAGLEPVVLENRLEGDELRTDVDAMRAAIERLGAENIVCVMTTTSCFAPRVPDRLEEVAVVCSEFNVPHLVNNAYGVQSSKCMHLIQQAQHVGRVDVFVQSTDKNFLVPVGGAVVAGFDTLLIEKIGKLYPGRASGSPTMDLFITLLSLDRAGYRKLLADRKAMFQYLQHQLSLCAERHGQRLLKTKNNPISIAMSLNGFEGSEATNLGSMLFTRCVSGVRVVTRGTEQEVAGHHFTGFGAHHSNYPCTYLTAAAALGITKSDVDSFIRRLDKVFAKKMMMATSQAADAMATLTVNGSKPCSADSAVGDSHIHTQSDSASSQND